MKAALHWQPVTQRMGYVDAAGRRLVVVIGVSADGRWYAIGVESEAGNRTLSSVLSDHAHVEVGDRLRSEASAVKASEAYARRWLRSKAPKKCACKAVRP